MTLNLSNNNWVKAVLITALALAAICLWSYLAGGIFLTAFDRKFDDATPLTLYQYWYYYGSEKAVNRWLYISGGISLVVLLLPFALFLAPAKRSLFGDARFATRREIKKGGLFGEKGIIVGKYGRQYLMFGGQQHAIISAPTRSGKGVGIVIPNLLNWPDSVVVLDIKQENWDITSAYRKKYGQACYLFNPAAVDYRTHRYNPLTYISDDPNFRIDDIQKIGNMLFPDQPGTDVIWTATPRSLFLGIVLYLCETPGKMVTLGQVLRETLTDGDGSRYFARIINTRAAAATAKQWSAAEAKAQAISDIAAYWTESHTAQLVRVGKMALYMHANAAYQAALFERASITHDGHTDGSAPNIASIVLARKLDNVEQSAVAIGKALSGTCARALNSYISIASDNTRSGIITSFRSRLELWMNPLVDAATSANDFDLRDVRKKRMSIYLGVTPDNLERMAPLLNLFFQQLIDLNTRELPNQNKSIKYTCMLLMDEFTAIGRIPILSKGISYIAGYWLRMLPIVQSPAQVVEVYGKEAAQTFTTNHALQIVFPPKASETQSAREISDWLGYQTVKGKSQSRGKGWFSKKQESENISDQKRALLLPQEITSLGKTRELVVMEDLPPILAKKVMYFEDRSFVDRLKEISPTLRALGAKLPSKQQLDDVVEARELGVAVPLIDLLAHERLLGVSDVPMMAVITPDNDAQVTTVERPVTPDDLPKLASLGLADFVVDFSSIQKPKPGVLDEAALHAYADSLCRQAGITI
jgi:type IV secretion system protein VirD4